MNELDRDADRPAARVLGLFAQIQHALERFAATAEPASFDLRSLPLTRSEEAYIEQLLGRGEVSCQLRALGESEVWETELAGVWLVVHRDPAGRVLAKLIEICTFPALLAAQPDDVREAVPRMQQRVQRAAIELEADGGKRLQTGEAP